MSRIAALISVLLAQGCSLIFVNGPPDGHERLRYFDCVSNGAGPAGDASWAIFDGLLAASAASVENGDGDSSAGGTVAAVFGVAAAIHAGSLVYGLVQTSDCSDAKQHLQQRIMDGDNEQRRRIEELERQLGAQQAAGAQQAPAPAEPRMLELAPAPEPQPAAPTAPPVTTTEVPPPPGAYTQPTPAQPAPAQPTPAQPAPAQRK